MFNTTDTIPFIIIFLVSFIWIGLKYLKYRSVVNETIPLENVKQRILLGENLIVYIIDPLKCSPCMDQFPKVKAILDRKGLPFVLVNYWEDEQFVKNLGEWKRVPALIAYKDSKPVKLIDASRVFRISMEQYESFAQEVNTTWNAA